MAKVKNPLLSESASGSIGKFLTFSARKTGLQVRTQKRQKDFTSELRSSARLYYSLGVAEWNALTLNFKLPNYFDFMKYFIGEKQSSSYGLRLYGSLIYG